MKLFLLAYLIGYLILNQVKGLEKIKKKLRFAIIGTGIAGTSASNYISKSFENPQITFFEWRHKIGGRLDSQYIPGYDKDIFEFGASYIIEKNVNLMELIKETNLTLKDPHVGTTMGIYRNNSFIFESSLYKVYDILRLFWKYGLDIYRLNSIDKSKIQKLIEFSSKNIEEFQTFKELEEFAELIDLRAEVNMTTRDFFQQNNISENVMNDLLETYTIYFYKQKLDINAFAGIVTNAGVQNQLVSVVGGNSQIAKKLIELNQNKYKVNQTVNLYSKVDRIINNYSEIEVHFSQNKSSIRKQQFDYVIIAAPLEIAQINLDNFNRNILENLKKQRKYIKTQLFFVHAKSLYTQKIFNRQSVEDIPTMTVFQDYLYEKVQAIIKICLKCSENNSKDIYGISGYAEISKHILDEIFEEHEIILIDRKYAYPNLKENIGKKLPHIILSDRVYYSNAMESLASCLELEALSSKNIVSLIYQREKTSLTQQDKTEGKKLKQEL